MRAHVYRLAASILALAAFDETVLAAPASLQTVEIIAEGMCCQGCARKVAGKLYTARGVRSVDTDVPTHVVKVQAPRAGTAYLGTLWDAVAAGDGAPTILTTVDATFRLAPANEPANPTNTMALRVDQVSSPEGAQRVADQFYAVEGVAEVRFDQQTSTFLVTTSPERRLNPWAAIDLVVRSGERPVSVVGPAGELSIEWTQPVATHPRNAKQTRLGGTSR